MKKPNKKDAPKTPRKVAKSFPPDVQRELDEAIRLREQEQGLLKDAEKVNRAAMLLAFSIGRIIHETPKEHSKGVVKSLAKKWHCSGQTVYNYEHLFCGAIYESNIVQFPNITRKYFQALGSSIRWADDFFGYLVHLQLMLKPAYLPSDDGDDPKVDHQRVLDIGQLVKDTRNVAVDDFKAGHLLNSWRREPDDEHGNPRFLFPVVEADSKMAIELRKLCGSLLHEVGLLLEGKFGTVKFQGFEDTKNKLYGSDTPDANFKSLTAKTILTRRLRVRRTEEAFTGTPPQVDKAVDTRVHHGSCEDVLSDRRLFAERSVDAVITDPPYSDEWYEAWKKWTKVDHDAEKTVAGQAELVGRVARLLVERRIAREQFSWFSFCPLDLVHMFLPPLLRAFEGKIAVYQVLAWDKGEVAKVGPTRYFGRQAEAVLYFNVGTRPLAMLKRDDDDPRLLHSSLLPFHVERKDRDNVFWKPVSVLKHLITLATGEGQSPKECNQVILDPFAGSGSTGVAAIECGREFRLIESHDWQHDQCRASVIEALKDAGRFEG